MKDPSIVTLVPSPVVLPHSNWNRADPGLGLVVPADLRLGAAGDEPHFGFHGVGDDRAFLGRGRVFFGPQALARFPARDFLAFVEADFGLGRLGGPGIRRTAWSRRRRSSCRRSSAVSPVRASRDFRTLFRCPGPGLHSYFPLVLGAFLGARFVGVLAVVDRLAAFLGAFHLRAASQFRERRAGAGRHGQAQPAQHDDQRSSLLHLRLTLLRAISSSATAAPAAASHGLTGPLTSLATRYRRRRTAEDVARCERFNRLQRNTGPRLRGKRPAPSLPNGHNCLPRRHCLLRNVLLASDCPACFGIKPVSTGSL